MKDKLNKEELIDQLYEVLYMTESEAAYKIIGDTIDYLKRQ